MLAAQLGTGAQDGHLDFHTPPELCQTSILRGVYVPCIYSHARGELLVGDSGLCCVRVTSFKR